MDPLDEMVQHWIRRGIHKLVDHSVATDQVHDAGLRQRSGEVVDVTVEGELREWQITYVA